jgi:DNA repair exonuclease SbcCD nuclease subunit
MKIALITDQHFGARNDSPVFLDMYEKFYTQVFFPKIDQENIREVLILGDTFDRRKYVNFYTLKRAKEMFFAPLANRGIKVHMLAGNHDTYFKNTNEVNSISLLLQEYDNINVIHHPSNIYVGENNEHKICMMPWICVENYEDSMETLKDTDAKYCMGHFEIDGFAMYRGMPSHEGLDRAHFRKFVRTFSGHYHHKSNSDSIHYLGNPYQLTWQDYGDDRGFHLFNLGNDDLEFVVNPFEIFHKVVYDDKEKSIKELTDIDFTPYTSTYVKVVVMNKTNPYLFDKFMNGLYNVNPADITIVEDFSEMNEGLEDDMVDQAEDTLTILGKYIDSVSEENIDNNRLKNLMKELYLEALNTET